MGPRVIDLMSSGFIGIRRDGLAYVDKTGPIADILADRSFSRRAFFLRPRRFGKSLTISVMAEMLAAGQLPAGVKPWPGYKPVDVEAVFGGLAVHHRAVSGDPIARGVLEQAHFVIKLPLGDAQTGTKLEQRIIERLATVAGQAFGHDIEAKVLRRNTPGSAMEALAAAVPDEVPIAVLVDEYDQAIINDVTKRRWAAGEQGVAALRSLMMATKAQGLDDRIKRFIVTGVARFARASLFSGANNFVDVTAAPIASRMLGFTEQEIRDNFPAELALLGKSVSSRDGTSVGSTEEEHRTAGIAALEHWYNGYCFDGVTSCYNPAPVLAALAAGEVRGTEMDGAAASSWLGLAPLAVLSHSLTDERSSTVESFDIADLEAQSVNATALLVQTGLLSLKPAAEGDTGTTSSAVSRGPVVTLRPPNQYARDTMLQMTAKLLVRRQHDLPDMVRRTRDALVARDHTAFGAILCNLLSSIPHSSASFKAAKGDQPPPREAPYHAFLYGLLLAVPHQLATLHIEKESAFGTADLVLELRPVPGRPAEVWILELGAITPKADRTVAQLVKQKREQVKRYYGPYALFPGRSAVIVVDRDNAKVEVAWDEWDVTAQAWKC